MKRVALIFAAVLFGCAEPASVRVTVKVKEAGLAEIRVRVDRVPANAMSVELARCVFPAGKKADPGCAMEDGNLRWDGDDPMTGPASLVFVMYGRPHTPLELTVEGARTRGGPVATSTSVLFELPAQRGFIENLEIELQSRTREYVRCPAISIAPDLGDTNNDRSAVISGGLIPPDGTPELITSSGGRLGFIRYLRDERGCSLVPREGMDIMMPNICRVRENSIVSGGVLVNNETNRRMVAAECQNSINPGEVRVVAIGYGDGQPVAFAALTLAPDLGSTEVSRPVLADLDGNGVRDVVFLINRSRVLTLGIWDPRVDPPAVVEIPLTGLTPYGQTVTGGPLIFRTRASGARDVALIAGYPGGIGVVTGSPPVFTLVHDEARARTPLMGAAATITAEDGDTATISVAALYAMTGLEVTPIHVRGGQFSEGEIYTIAAPNPDALAADAETRIAIGDVDASGVPSAVIVHAGHAIVFPMMKDATASTFQLWTDTAVQDVQTVMLANVDGQPGAEIIAFDPDSPLIHAADHTGRLLDGWPIQAIQGGSLRMFVSNLEQTSGPRDDLELVTLSLRSLQVIVLGPGSYDVDATPWPFPQHDPRSAAVHGPGERDPRAPAAAPTP